MPRFSVYQLGRGSEPVIVVGNMMSFVPRYIATPPKSFSHRHFSRALTGFARLYIGRSVKQQKAAAAMPAPVHCELFWIGLGYRPDVGTTLSDRPVEISAARRADDIAVVIDERATQERALDPAGEFLTLEGRVSLL